MVDPTERAALLAERFGRIFGEDDSAGDRGTAIVRRTANSIAAMIRSDSDTHRMAETGTGSGRSLSSAGRATASPNPSQDTPNEE